MKKINLYIFLSFVLMIISSCATSSKIKGVDVMPPQEGAKNEMVKQSVELNLNISVEKQKYVLGEPVYLLAELINESNQSLKLNKHLRPGDGSLEIMIRDSKKEATEFVPLEEADIDMSSRAELRPGQSFAAEFQIFFGGHGWSFPKAGVYQIKASYKSNLDNKTYVEVESKPIKIEIADKSSQLQKELVSGSRMSYQSGLFLTWGSGDHLTKGHSMLQKLLESGDSQQLGNYINLAFGKSFSDSFMDYRSKSKEARPADYKRALEYLDKVNVRYLPRYLKVQFHLAKIRCSYNHQEQNGDLAMRHFDALDKLIGDEVAYEALYEKIIEMKGRVK